MFDISAFHAETKKILLALDGKRYPEAFAALSDVFLHDETPFEVASRLMACDKPGPLPPFLVEYITALYQIEIDAGNHHAMNNLGAHYYSGARGFAQSFEKAVELYQMAALNGNLQAQENLGYCYYYGRDMDVDYEKAFHYFALGAFAGQLVSLYKIGDMYRNGYYVRKNEGEAFRIYTRCLALMTDADRDAVAGPVRLRLGDMYLNGTGTAQNAEAALFNYSVAEIALLQMVKKGEYMYKKSLQAAVAGQERARALLAEALPEDDWTFDD